MFQRDNLPERVKMLLFTLLYLVLISLSLFVGFYYENLTFLFSRKGKARTLAACNIVFLLPEMKDFHPLFIHYNLLLREVYITHELGEITVKLNRFGGVVEVEYDDKTYYEMWVCDETGRDYFPWYEHGNSPQISWVWE